MPAEKCLPVDEITMTRAFACSSIERTISGNSRQNSGTMVLSSSPRLSSTRAMLSATRTSKQR